MGTKHVRDEVVSDFISVIGVSRSPNAGTLCTVQATPANRSSGRPPEQARHSCVRSRHALMADSMNEQLNTWPETDHSRVGWEHLVHIAFQDAPRKVRLPFAPAASVACTRGSESKHIKASHADAHWFCRRS
jgi:hypothetical protein